MFVVACSCPGDQYFVSSAAEKEPSVRVSICARLTMIARTGELKDLQASGLSIDRLSPLYLSYPRQHVALNLVKVCSV